MCFCIIIITVNKIDRILNVIDKLLRRTKSSQIKLSRITKYISANMLNICQNVFRNILSQEYYFNMRLYVSYHISG